MSSTSDTQIYVDGACFGNGTPSARGGYGVWFGEGDTRNISARLLGDQTNNRAELSAAIAALGVPCSQKDPVTIYTDSEYVKNGITEWMKNWKKNGWRTAARKPVKNADLWRALDVAREGRTVTWNWVKGHSGNPGNEAADALANAGAALEDPVPKKRAASPSHEDERPAKRAKLMTEAENSDQLMNVTRAELLPRGTGASSPGTRSGSS